MSDSAPLASVRQRLADPAELSALMREAAGPTSAVVAVAWWLIEVTRSWGGWDAPAVTIGAALTALAVVLTRPDRVLPPVVTILATVVSGAAFLVAVVAPTGWAGAPVAALYASAAWICVVVAAASMRHQNMALWLLIVVVASAPIEFISGWLGWWGGRDPSRPMVGTFYWYNPYAAFLIPGGLVGLAFFVWKERLFALVGLIAFVFASIGIVYSTSRASLACYILGFAAVALSAVLDRKWRRSVRQLVIGAAIAAGAAFAIGGPPFFPHRASPLAGEQARAVGQTLGQNGGYRLEFWREALTVFRLHPVTGGGYKSLVSASAGHVPKSWAVSAFAHNGYLQALSDGGLLLAIPFFLAVIAIVALAARALYLGIRRRQPGLTGFVVPVALGCLLIHSGVDFDWVYGADFAFAGILAGLVLADQLGARNALAQEGDQPPPPKRAAWPPVLAACLVVAVGLLGLSAWAMRNGDHKGVLRISHHSAG